MGASKSRQSRDLRKRRPAVHYRKQKCRMDAELLVAAQDGDIERIDRCMDLGADVNARDPHGQTPLMYASTRRYTRCVERLVHTWAADVNAESVEGADIVSALMYAAEKGHHQCMDILIQAGADVNAGVNCKPLMMATVAFQYESMRKLIHAGADVNTTNNSGMTALLLACKRSLPCCVKLLIQQGANVNIRDKLGTSPLISIVVSRVNYAELLCLDLLLRAGAHVNKTNRSGKNALTLHFTGTEPVNRRAVLLLLVAGERLHTRRKAGFRLTWDENYSHVEIPDHLLYKKNLLDLKHVCRDVIRKHMLKVSSVNLFTRAPGLGLPSVLTSYILYNVS